MGRKEELKSLNTPIDGKHYRFVLGDGGFTFAEYDLTLSGLVPIDEQFAWYFTYFTETQYVNDNIQLAITSLSTIEDIYDQVIADDLYTTLNGLDYLYVTHLLGVMHVKIRINPYIVSSAFGAYFDTNPITYGPVTYSGGNYELKFAPDGWEDDEYGMNRNMPLFGVFRKFTVGELKFVKDGRDYLATIYESTGVNSNCTLTVYETPPSGVERVRFIGKIDFSTYKITELSVDVQVIDGSFTDLVLSRMATDVNLLGEKTIDGTALPSPTTVNIIRPELNLNQFSNWTSGTGTITKVASHILPTSIEASEYEEAEATDEFSEFLFLNASKDYLQSMIYTEVTAVAHGNDANAYFSWSIRLDRYSGGVFAENIWTEDFICEGLTTNIVIDNAYGINLLEGESLKIHAVYTPSIGTGNIIYDAFEGIRYKFNWLVVDYPASTMRGMLYHEAFERLIYIYTGLTGRFKSDFLGRTDIGYVSDGTALGAVTTGRDFNGANFWNDTLTTSLDKLFKSLQSVYCLGIGVELIGGVEKVVIEEMSHFFDANVIINVSDRIAPETIIKEYYPELAYNRISVGFNSFEYKSLGGVYEFNTTSKFSTVIKPVDKELNIVSPIRGDMSGIIACLELGGTNYDSDSLQDTYIVDTIRDGGSYTIQTNEGFEYVDNVSNRDTLINLMYSPARNLRRWGSYLRGFLEKYLTSLMVWQSSDKNTKLVSTEWGGTEITENGNVLVSDLADPMWHPEIFTLEIPALENDINLINENPYGLIQITASEYGWILSYKSKNENGKSEFTLLRCNTDYITPIGDPVYPATVTIKKTVTGATVDYTTFNVSMIGDNGTSYTAMPIVNGESGQIELTNVPYGTYTITENAETGYTLTSIIPSMFTLDRDNLHFDVEIVNSKDPVIETIKYGALYNWYDIANVARNGFEVPTQSKITTLLAYIGANSGGHLKESGSTYWLSPNTGADNSYEFNARGASPRSSDGTFVTLKSQTFYWNIEDNDVLGYCLGLYYNQSNSYPNTLLYKNLGCSLRLIKTVPTTSDLLKADGEACDPYFDGEFYYRTVKIGTQVWVADNIKTRYYADDSPIPVVTDNAAWAALTTGARCSYNNDDSNL